MKNDYQLLLGLLICNIKKLLQMFSSLANFMCIFLLIEQVKVILSDSEKKKPENRFCRFQKEYLP